jgi:hypothetical protein
MALTTPIHRVTSHPSNPTLYLATSTSLHAYSLLTSSIATSFHCETGYAHLLVASKEWVFISGGEKILRVLNAHTLECVAEL